MAHNEIDKNARHTKASKKSFKAVIGKSLNNLFSRLEDSSNTHVIRNHIEDSQLSTDKDAISHISSSTPTLPPREPDIESDLKSLISRSERSSLRPIMYCTDYNIDGLALMPDDVNLPKTEYVNLYADNLVETNREYKTYAQIFKGQEHFDFVGKAENYGDFLLSIKSTSDSHLTCILRTKDGNEFLNDLSIKYLSLQNILNKFNDSLNVIEMKPVLHPTASELIANYDREIIKLKFTFGIIYQKFGQTNEKEIFDNQLNSAQFNEFLDFIGERIKLKNFASFKGGLDVTSDDTGHESIYTKFQDSEIMFHVSTLLPHSNKDTQQIERKRHIGNDRVAIVFQDELTPFSPLMIKSKLLHVFIIVQPVRISGEIDGYQVSILSRKDVPPFEPIVEKPYVYKKDELFRSFLLTKLINAEYASLRAPAFSHFSEKTLSHELSKLCENLRYLTTNFSIYELNRPPITESPKPSNPFISDDSQKLEPVAKIRNMIDKVKINTKKSIMRRNNKIDKKTDSNRKKSEDKISIYETDPSMNDLPENHEQVAKAQDETNSNIITNTNTSSDRELSVHSPADLSLRAQMPSMASITNLDTSQSKSLDSINANPTSKRKTSKFSKRIEVLV